MKLLNRRTVLCMMLVVGTWISGCRKSTERLGSNTLTFPITGTVMATNPSQSEITLQHGAIPGFMEAMTMPYRLDRPEVVNELHPGDVIRARLLVDKLSDGGYRNARLNEIAVLAQKRLDVKPTSNYHVPTKGDVVPDFDLINQDGHPMKLSSLKGKAVLLTFIYTRCPLGDYCPKMSRNFQQIQAMMKADKALQAKSDFLSVSFDPAFDTPSVLRAYGKNYVGDEGFAHWQFVRTKDDQTLKGMEQFFNLGATPENNGSITHSLSTVLIDPQGRIVDWYPGNEWSPQEVFAKLQSIAG